MIEKCERLPELHQICACLAVECPLAFNASTHLMEKCFMDLCFLPKQVLPFSSLTKVTALYFLLFVVGVSGNLLTCVVIRKHPLLKTNNSSYYLLNLAIADLVTLCVGLPFEVVMNWHQWPWPFPDWVCNLKGLIAETTISVSILTILLFSVERYIAVCQPFFFVKIKKHLPKYVISFMIIIWVVSIISSVPFGYYHKADYFIKSWPYTDNNIPVLSSKMCMMQGIFDPDFLPTFKVLFHFSALAFFVFPLFIIFILYAMIAKHVFNSKKEIDSFGKDLARTDEDATKKVTTILCAIVFTFFICYLPFQFQRLAFFYIEKESVENLNQYVYFISGILFYLAPIINPILYNVVSSRFRRAFKDVLNEMCGRKCTGGNRIISVRSIHNFNYSHVSDRCQSIRNDSVDV